MLSLTNKNWSLLQVPYERISECARVHGISEYAAEVLLKRGIDDIKNFINPKIKFSLQDPLIIYDMDKAVKRIIQAVNRKEKILIWGDYDVDGISSISMLVNYFNEIGFSNYTYYVPNRKSDGYGLAGYDVEHYKNYNVIIAVDCGSQDFEKAILINDNQQDLIILDHHDIDTTFPKACAFVNPKIGNSFFSNFCAAGVVFLFLIALNRELRTNEGFDFLKKLDLLKYTEILSIATICDVMPLISVNRAIVKTGILSINLKKQNLGLSTLIQESKIDNVNSENIGFIIGPKLNAAGRLGDAKICVELLTSNKLDYCKSICQQLDLLNKERKLNEQKMLQNVIPAAEEQLNDKIILICYPNLDIGVLGIVASRLAEQFNKPAIVLSILGDICKGSGRSIKGCDLGKIIADVRCLLINGGGHANAVGLTIEKTKIELLKQALETSEYVSFSSTEKINGIDLECTLRAINLNLIECLSILEPFGECNQAPQILINNVFFKKLHIFLEKHCSGFLVDESGYVLKSTIFNYKRYVKDYKLLYEKGLLSIVGVLRKDQYGEININISDIF